MLLYIYSSYLCTIITLFCHIKRFKYHIICLAGMIILWYTSCKETLLIKYFMLSREEIRTRSIPRAQTSTTSSLKSVIQSTQASNSVAYCFLCPYPENFMNVHPSGIPWCASTDPENRKRNPVSKGYTNDPLNVWDFSLCHSQHILKISWKSTHLFYRGVANKHARGAKSETMK